MALFSTALATQNFNRINKRKAEPYYRDSNFPNFEYRTFEEYRDAGGTYTLENWKGQDAKWLKSDRESSNHPRWRMACNVIIKNKLENWLTPFEQVADFYRYTQLLVNHQKHQSRWLYGAYYLVSDLANLYDKGLSLEMIKFILPLGPILENTIELLYVEKFKELLTQLNRAIANYAVGRFHDLLDGNYSKVPITGLTAWKFDKQFVIEEQGDTAKSIYADQSLKKGKDIENLIFNHGGTFILFLINNKLNIPDFGYIPVFQDQYNSDLTANDNNNPNYGLEARIEVPLAMLYPNEFFYNDDAKLDVIPTKAPINLKLSFKDSKFGKTLKRGKEKKGNARDIQIYTAYTRANTLIKKRLNKINGKK